MKILKIRIVLLSYNGKIKYKYPEGYKPNLINVIAYSPEKKDNNTKVRYCIGLIEDNNISQFNKSNDIIEISKEEADILGKEWRPSNLNIVYKNIVYNILKKLSRGITISKEERKILDPDDSTLGINYNKKFDINNYL